MTAGTTTAPEAIHGIIDWLTTQPAGDVVEEIRALSRHFALLDDPAITSAQYHRCIELFHTRALRLSTDYRARLREQGRPLNGALREASVALSAILLRIAKGFERVLEDAHQGALRTLPRLNDTVAARALRLQAENFLIVQQAGLEAPADFWSCAHRIFALSRYEADAQQQPGSPAESALAHYKRLLSLGTLDTPGLAPAELDWAAEYLQRASNQLHLQEERPTTPDTTWYWLDPDRGGEPYAWVRREPPREGRLLYFSTAVLARRAAEALTRHDAGRNRVELFTDENGRDVQPAALLSRLRQRWTAPARRELPRREQHYAVDACVGLAAIWKTLRHGNSDDVSRWEVLNESPGGFSIMQLRSLAAGVSAGTAIALRREPNEDWSICIVRWLRSDAPGRVEIGLQIVSQGAIPVQVGFRQAERRMTLTEALVLPVLPALRQHQAILAPSGTYTSRRFALLSDVDRLYVAQGRLLSLDMQTSNIELFQFEIDPYPI
ncbi:MAG: hypothetical protein QM803_01525 [Rhodocyclaceae bacterium]